MTGHSARLAERSVQRVGGSEHIIEGLQRITRRAHEGNEHAVALHPPDVIYLSATRTFHTYARDSQRFRQVSRGFRRVFARVSRGFRGGFAGVSRGFRGVSRAFRPIRKLTNRFTWFSNPSLASQSFAKFTPLSHVSHHFRSVSQGILTKFRSRFTAVSQPFHKPSRDFAAVKRCEGVR